MAKRAKKQAASKVEAEALTGWQQIAAFLGHPAAVVQRWASEGMPVRRQGRFVTTTPEELNAWLGRESGKPVHLATEDTDLAAELKRGLAFVRRNKEPNAAKKQAAQPKKAKRR
jgi:phage terminase Nu1 subunit (DNA packaging protein)